MNHRLRQNWCHFLYVQYSAKECGSPRISTAACSPAPSRCLLIVRDDVQPAPSGMFLTFEGILSSTTNNKSNPYEIHSSRDLLTGGGNKNASKQPLPASKRRWGLFRSLKPLHSAGEDAKGGVSSVNTATTAQSHPGNGNMRDSDRPASPLRDGTTEPGLSAAAPESKHIALSFKFSLEWMDRDDVGRGKDRRLSSPEMPLPARLSRRHKPDEPSDNEPCKPEGAAFGASKYSGRALAEWADLIAECQNFFDRRRAEGVPSFQLVETPMLSVDPFRKI